MPEKKIKAVHFAIAVEIAWLNWCGAVLRLSDAQVHRVNRAVVVGIALGETSGATGAALPDQEILAIDVVILVEVGRLVERDTKRKGGSSIIEERGGTRGQGVVVEVFRALISGLCPGNPISHRC